MDLRGTLRQTREVANPETRVRRIPLWAWGAFLGMVTLAVFLPTLRYPFFPYWDDDIHVHANPHLALLSWESFLVFWSGPYQQLYIPLTYSSWAGLAAMSRWWDGQPIAEGALNAAWFHGANIIVHAASAVLAFVLLRHTLAKLSPGAKGNRIAMAAVLGAGFFAFHPLQVEPVAWISGLRDVLGGCLGLAALVVLFAGERPGLVRWFCATLLFLASLAAKPAGVALPVAAGLLAFVPFGWKPGRIARELGPWVMAGLLWVFITSNAQWAAELAENLVPVWMRPLVAADALAFYTAKVLWPAGLSADYGRAPDTVLSAGWLWWTWMGPAALAATLAAVKRLRIYLVPFGIFAIALLPTLGLVPFNFQIVSTVADRYAYFALLGPALALGMIVARSNSTWILAAAAAVVVAMGTLTVVRLPLWSDDLKLFAATLSTNPESWKAIHNYASALDDRGRTVEAVPLMREVIAKRPDSSEAHNDLGVMLWTLGQREDAIEITRRSYAIRATPGAARNLATMEAGCGNQRGQIEALRAVLELEPGDLDSARWLAWVLATSPDNSLRNGQEAVILAERVLREGGTDTKAVLALIAAQAETGRFEEAGKNARSLIRMLEASGDPAVTDIRKVVTDTVEAGRPIRSRGL